MEKTLLSVKQVAEKLQLCEATIREYLKAGRLRAIKIGRCWRIDAIELERLMQESAS